MESRILVAPSLPVGSEFVERHEAGLRDQGVTCERGQKLNSLSTKPGATHPAEKFASVVSSDSTPKSLAPSTDRPSPVASRSLGQIPRTALRASSTRRIPGLV
jgi:hypothetical protein